MSRFRSLLLALGVITLMVAGGAMFLHNQAIEQADESRRLAAAERVSTINENFERNRAITLLAARESAFVDFYRAPGTREERILRGGRLMQRVNDFIDYLQELYPDSIGEASFIDRSGAENARVLHGRPAAPSELSPDESEEPYFFPAFAAPIGQVYQSAPYFSADTGEWVISHATKIDTGRVISPAIVHFEVRIESLAEALGEPIPGSEVRLVDVRTGDVINSAVPQRAGDLLDVPGDDDFAWVKTATAKSGTTHVSDGKRHALRLVSSGRGNANLWAVVVSTPQPAGPWVMATSRGPVAATTFVGLLCLALSVVAYVRHGRDMKLAARVDDLTLLPNRLAFRERLNELLRDGRRCAVLLLDLNRFKEINDTLGHQAGDELLFEVGRRLQRSMRGHGEAAARLGGDEFVVVAPGVETTEGALKLAERIERQLEHPLQIQGVPIRLSASVGVALIPTHANEFGAVLRCADIAMYAAKEHHAGPVVYDSGLDMHSPQRLGLDAQLAHAVANDELEIFYQPIYDLETRRVSRLEALVRWRHPKLGLLKPAEFIPRAEETGFIRVITRAVLWKSLDHLAEWRASGLDVSLNVNVSAAELSDEFFASEVRALLVAQSVPAHYLTLELTESALLTESQRSADNLRSFTAMGVGLAIDDFGTGYSSLAQLRMCPATQLKIDGNLVASMVNSPVDALIVRSTIELGDSLGLVVIAEGVENETTLGMLEMMGCREVQGHLFAPAEAFGNVREWLPGRGQATTAT